MFQSKGVIIKEVKRRQTEKFGRGKEPVVHPSDLTEEILTHLKVACDAIFCNTPHLVVMEMQEAKSLLASIGTIQNVGDPNPYRVKYTFNKRRISDFFSEQKRRCQKVSPAERKKIQKSLIVLENQIFLAGKHNIF